LKTQKLTVERTLTLTQFEAVDVLRSLNVKYTGKEVATYTIDADPQLQAAVKNLLEPKAYKLTVEVDQRGNWVSVSLAPGEE
jgi:hypothetical protein